MTDITNNLQAVRKRIAAAATECGRDPSDVMLLAVSKGQPMAAIVNAAAAGQRDFGENYLQDATAKILGVADSGLSWHFIGHLQSNKTREVAASFDWVHTVDSVRIARRLSDQRPPAAAPLNICLQVRIGDEATKSGVRPEDVAGLAAAVAPLGGLRLRGLMCIPPPSEDRSTQRAHFAGLRTLYEALRADGYKMDTLSMGMSADLEAAIAEGATIVRVGTAIFGPRRKS
ncbi:MAG: YggS family pyridoxal phosphate-dependent enzyme [Chromatiales bacterium]